jgi:hypothetical protein
VKVSGRTMPKGAALPGAIPWLGGTGLEGSGQALTPPPERPPDPVIRPAARQGSRGVRVPRKLTLRSDSDLLARVKQVEEREGVSRSDLVRGAVIAVKEDVFDRPRRGRLGQLRAIAEAV